MTLARIAVLIVTVLWVCGACSGRSPDDITARLQQDEEHLDLAAAMPGPWERAYVFGEYDTAGTIQAALCHDWDDAEAASGYTKTDAYYVVVFVEGSEVLSWATVNVDTDGGPSVAFDSPAAFYVAHRNATFVRSAGPAGSTTLRPTEPQTPNCG